MKCVFSFISWLRLYSSIKSFALGHITVEITRYDNVRYVCAAGSVDTPSMSIIIEEGHIRIIPAKFGFNLASNLRGYCAIIKP